MVMVVTEKHLKQLFHSSKTLFFRLLNLITLFLFEEMLVLTYERQLQQSNNFSFTNCFVMSRLLTKKYRNTKTSYH